MNTVQWLIPNLSIKKEIVLSQVFIENFLAWEAHILTEDFHARYFLYFIAVHRKARIR
jgi:hypothetical protein